MNVLETSCRSCGLLHFVGLVYRYKLRWNTWVATTTRTWRRTPNAEVGIFITAEKPCWNPLLIHWMCPFLSNRTRLVKVNKTLSSTVTTNAGAPQGCVSSAALFTLYTDDCRIDTPSQYISKHSADTVLLSLLNKSGTTEIHQQGVNKVLEWSDLNTLEINTQKTEETVFGSPPDSHRTPCLVHTAEIRQVSSYEYLGVWIDNLIDWKDHIDSVCNKTKQRIYFLHRLRSFGASRPILPLFFTSVIMSILQYCDIVRYKGVSATLRAKLSQQFNICSQIVGQPPQKLYETANHDNMLRLANNINSNQNRVLNKEVQLIPSNCRFKVPSFNKIEFKNYFAQ